MLSRLYDLDHLYGLLLTFGLALIIEGLFINFYGVSGQPYAPPDVLKGGYNLGFMFLPAYRGWVIVASLIVCFGTWLLIERTRLGAYLRAAVENRELVRAFGINVPLMMTLTYGFAVALAGFAGILAAPVYTVSPIMGQNLIIVVFAIVVIGGLGSILGSIVTGLGIGLIEGLTKTFYPEASSTVVFVIMAIVLRHPAERPVREAAGMSEAVARQPAVEGRRRTGTWIVAGIGIVLLLVAPFLGLYPVFLMKLMCFALFACAFNLMLGYVGLLSFGHAAFFGMAAYVAGHAVKVWGLTTVLGILCGTAVAGVMGLVFGAIAIRQRGIYFAMITLALAQMAYFFCLQVPFTHGEDGIQGIPRGTAFGLFDLRDTLTMYYFVAAIFLIGFLVIYRTVNSPFGQTLKGIRENEPRMVSLGYNVTRFKVLAFTISATLTGLAGATKVFVFQAATLTDVHWQMSGRGRADDADRRHGHDIRAPGRRRRRDRAAELPGDHRLLGHRGDGLDLRHLRPDLPARHRRRDPGPRPAEAVAARAGRVEPGEGPAHLR